MLTNALQARGAATESLIVNISRQGLIYIPSMFILGAIFHETGLIWAQPVADVLSLLLAIGLYFRMSGKGNDLSSKGRSGFRRLVEHLGDGILCKSSCSQPNGQRKPQINRPSSTPNKIRMPVI